MRTPSFAQNPTSRLDKVYEEAMFPSHFWVKGSMYRGDQWDGGGRNDGAIHVVYIHSNNVQVDPLVRPVSLKGARFQIVKELN